MDGSPQSKAGALKQVLWSKIAWFVAVASFFPVEANAWTNGELSIWMDGDRGRALEPILKKYTDDSGIKVKIESPEKLTESFGMAAQVSKGPDIVIWAHDKLGEWADGGLIAPIELSQEFLDKFLPKAWEAVAKANPQGRLAEPDEVAAMVAFLLSDDAGHVTGAMLPVDGRLTLM